MTAVSHTDESGPVAGPLTGLLVADFSRVLAGPYVGMTLGDLGADVIKIERPGAGDDTRGYAPPWSGGLTTYFQCLNRNKRSLTLDLADSSDQLLAQRLVQRADVLIENFRPGTLNKYGLGYADASATNPRLVYCSISGFGEAAQALDLPGYDLLAQAASGMMSITGEPDGQPLKVGVALVDHITALQATVGVMAALAARDRDGVGQRVTVSLMGTALAAMVNQASGYLGAGVVPGRMGNRHPSITPYQTYRTVDGHFVLACGNDRQFRAVCAEIERPELADDERYATNAQRVANRAELEVILSAAFERRAAEELTDSLMGRGVPAGVINDVAQAFEMAERVGLQVIDTVRAPDGHEQRHVSSPIGFSRTPTSTRLPAPALGADNDELRAWLAV